MKVNYQPHDRIHDRPPHLLLTPETDADQAALNRIHHERPDLVMGMGVDPLTMTYRHMEVRLSDEGG